MNADAHAMLGSAIAGLFHPAAAELRRSSQSRWSSVTFTGARHRFALGVSGRNAMRAVDRALRELDQREFALPGHVVADIALVGRNGSPGGIEIELEALTVEAN